MTQSKRGATGMDVNKTKRMKSIKKMAIEHAPYTRDDSWNKIQKCIIAQTSFEAGANCVLDEIEEIINHPRRFVNDDKTIEEGMIEEISKLVEQLKK